MNDMSYRTFLFSFENVRVDTPIQVLRILGLLHVMKAFPNKKAPLDAFSFVACATKIGLSTYALDAATDGFGRGNVHRFT